MKPYPAYKESGVPWLGRVPEHWEVKRLKFSAKVNPSRSEIKGLPEDIEVSFYPMEAVGFGKLYEGERKVLKDVASGFTYFRDDDVLIAKITPSFENGKGALATRLINSIGFGTTELHVIRPLDGLDKEYFFYLTYSHEFRHPGEGMMDGTAGQKRIPSDFLTDYRIALPPLSEQTAIANYLDRKTAQIDAVIAKKERLIKLLREERTALISQAVTKGLNPDAPMKDSGVPWLGQIPEHWDTIRVKLLAGNDASVVQTGPFGAQLHASDYVQDEDGIPLILIRNVKDLYIDTDEIPKISRENAKRLSMYRLCIGDIVFSRVGSIGRIALVTEREEGWLISGQMLRLRLGTSRLNMKYAVFAFSSKSILEFVKLESVGSTRESINTEILRNLPILLPPLLEQIAIADYLDQKTVGIDQTVARTERQIELLREYRIVLISAVVTGKVDVREEAAL